MKKVFKGFILFLAIILSLTSVGCINKEITEKRDEAIISFPIPYYSYLMSSARGQAIKLTLDGATFECEIEKGSFEFYNDVKRITIASSETIHYCPMYIFNESRFKFDEDSFVDIKILIDNEIIGYAVIKIIFEENNLLFRPKILVSNIFVDGNGKHKGVDEIYVAKRIKKYHK